MSRRATGPEHRHLWLIDDTPTHHVTAELTLRSFPGWQFTGYHGGSEAIEAYRDLVAIATLHAALPTVILMDYFIGHDHGDEVTVAFRHLEPPRHRPIIIGYSSVRSASERIIASGGDLIMPKVRSITGVNPHLHAYLAKMR